jgi:hypothetical protein
MSIAAELLQRHIETLVDDHQQWQGLIADNIVWERAYAAWDRHPPLERPMSTASLMAPSVASWMP